MADKPKSGISSELQAKLNRRRREQKEELIDGKKKQADIEGNEQTDFDAKIEGKDMEGLEDEMVESGEGGPVNEQ